jgi:hypothetical protein
VTVALIALIGFLLLGLLVGRWWSVPVVATLFPLYVLGVKVGLWGHGTGDNWEIALALGAAIPALGAAAGVALHRGTRTRRSPQHWRHT